MQDRVEFRKKKVPELLKYFPEPAKDDLPDRTYLWTVLSNLRPDGWKTMLEQARKARCKQSEDKNNEFIDIHPDFLNKILETLMFTKGTFIFQSKLTYMKSSEGQHFY